MEGGREGVREGGRKEETKRGREGASKQVREGESEGGRRDVFLLCLSSTLQVGEGGGGVSVATPTLQQQLAHLQHREVVLSSRSGDLETL